MNAVETKQFRAFLKENKATVKYRVNIKETHGKTMAEWLKNIAINRVFISAFVWSETPEEHTYWSKLSEEWNELLESKVDSSSSSS